MPELTEIQGSDRVKNSRQTINENFKAVASDFAGTAFPVQEVNIGTTCYRTDLKKLYRYIDVGLWRLELDLSGNTALIAEAAHAANADNDKLGQQIDATYIKNLKNQGNILTIVRGDGSELNLQLEDNNDKVSIGNAPVANKKYAILVNKAGTESGTDAALIDTQIIINPSDHRIIAPKFEGTLEGNADNDKLGQQIDATYIKEIKMSGGNIIAVKGDGTEKSQVADSNFSTEIEVTASKQGERIAVVKDIQGTLDNTEASGSGNIVNTTYTLETHGSIQAGIYSLGALLQELVDASHNHKTRKKTVNSNCNCKCNCDCSDDGE